LRGGVLKYFDTSMVLHRRQQEYLEPEQSERLLVAAFQSNRTPLVDRIGDVAV